MTTNWLNCSINIKEFVLHILNETKGILKTNFSGFYLHGSLAMGGFNPKCSDIDILIVTNKAITNDTKKNLAHLFLTYSANPFPVEVSILAKEQLETWKHPFPYEFHYSEYWRKRYEDELASGVDHYLTKEVKTDVDLAAHIMVLRNRGICLEGKAIDTIFPSVPHSDFLSSIMDDFQACVKNIEKDPVYCTLNLLRVFWYLKEGTISSKLEAGSWGIHVLPKEMQNTIQKVVTKYSGLNQAYEFEKAELMKIKDYIVKQVYAFLR
ncbi:aminoglycoside adenylyltransferase domain-containing protein [Ornithinibacillus contaminans]|uniref:aminoglycoside adenylyltransferase domain-containing protein n=1 Tax=Ornithinibacillus contaminans TaxID=694055 RepID=UPI00064DDB2C|nr:aminoglycoside adenylyltransferase domain-containing protein [Ornithinibacillus contaminans]